MATEKLIVQLESDTTRLKADLDKVDNQLNSIDGSTKKADASFNLFSDTTKSVASGVLSAVTAIVAIKGAIDAMVLSSAQGRAELEQLSKQAKLSAEQFQALSFATKQYGVNAEQIADISKDISDRLGEFATAGTGTFQDFLDVMGMTKEEGVALAKQFQNMSSDQVIGEMVSRMEEAGATGNQMTFVLESMGNDLSRLTPLFANNSEKLKELTSAYSAANSQMAITAEQADELRKVSTSFDLMTEGISNATTAISATLAPSLSAFFNSIIEIVPDATQKIIDFINSFQDAENITNLKDMDTQIAKLQERAEALEQYRNVSDVFGSAKDIASRQELAGVEDRLNELYYARLELQKKISENSLSDADRSGGGDISGSGSGTSGVSGKDTADKLKSLEDEFKSEEKLLTEKYDREMALAAGNKELLLEVENRYITQLMELDEAADAARYEAQMERWREIITEQAQEKFDTEIAEQQKLLEQKLINEEDYLKEVNRIGQKYGKVETAAAKKKSEDKTEFESDYAMSALQIGEMLFEGNKALEAGLVVAKTGAAVMHQLGSGDPYTAFARAATAGAIGAVQLAQTLSATKGGGSISTPSATVAPTENTSRFSSSVEVNESVVGGGNVSNTVNFTADDADGIGGAIASWLNDKLKDGSVKLGG